MSGRKSNDMCSRTTLFVLEKIQQKQHRGWFLYGMTSTTVGVEVESFLAVKGPRSESGGLDNQKVRMDNHEYLEPSSRKNNSSNLLALPGYVMNMCYSVYIYIYPLVI